MVRKKRKMRKFTQFLIVLLFIGLGYFVWSNFTAKEEPVPPFVFVPKDPIDYRDEGGQFELPLNGSSGYASVLTPMYKDASENSEIKAIMAAGQVFTIRREQGAWWYIEMDGMSGWIQHRFALINLPDVIPSIVYDIKNAYASDLQSSGKPIPNITGVQLYDAKAYNQRFESEEFIVPILYATALKVQKAQDLALENGETLLVHEAYRPAFAQKQIVDAMRSLVEQDEVVKQGVSQAPWSMVWFIATGVSNHQRGYALDMSLAKVLETKLKVSGDYQYADVTKYEEYAMPSAFHELSVASVTFTEPVDSYSDSAWRMSIFASSMNQAAKDLQTYSTKAGLTPLASEWWHFNDLAQELDVKASGNVGKYQIRTNQSVVPRS